MAENGSAGRVVTPSDQMWAQPSGIFERLSRAVRQSGDRHANQSELLAILHDVADTVSEVVDVDRVLDVVVENAKRITGTDKAIIVLIDEHLGGLDHDTFVVRGRKDQHEQEWWERRLKEIGTAFALDLEPLLEEHPEHNAWLLCCPVIVKGSPVGLLCAVNESTRQFTRIQRDSLAILSAFAASSIENARLAEQTRYAFLAGERDRIAREMHDGVVQSLFSISLGLEVCKKRIFREPDAVAERLDELQLHLNSAMTELRRFIYDLRSVKLVELGLVGAVEFWVSEITMGRAIKGSVTVVGQMPRLSPSQEAALYRVAKESVSNAVRHSGARSVTVTIEAAPDEVLMVVADDGHGFDPNTVRDGGATGGIGLDSIRQRVGREGGQIDIRSRVGEGTRIAMQLPVRGSTR